MSSNAPHASPHSLHPWHTGPHPRSHASTFAASLVAAAAGCAAEPPDENAPAWRQGNGAPEQGRVPLCHDAAGDRHTIVVAAAAISAHLAHGDVLGECPAPCVSAAGCSDDDPCTTDVCNPDGTCSHAPVDCEDGDPCTLESCSPSLGCGSAPADGELCDDGNECTDDDACAAGSCQGAAIAGCCADADDCDDADACTLDACTAGACANTSIECTVADACVVGFCDPSTGECDATPVWCDDGNPCTADGCDPAAGCVHAPASDWACGSIRRLSDGVPSVGSPPEISGTRVAWAEFSGPGTTDVMLHDLATGTTQNLTGTPSEWENAVDLDAEHAVWRHSDVAGASEIVVHTIATGARTIAATSGANETVWDPSIHYGVVAWTRLGPYVDHDIEVYYTSTGGSWSFRGGGTNGVSNMRVTRGTYGTTIVYEGLGQQGRGIVAFDLGLGPLDVPPPTESVQQIMPDNDGATVVYVERGSEDRLLAYHTPVFDTTIQLFPGGTPRVLSSVTRSRYDFPRISDTRVVWADDRTGDFDLYAYDLATGLESRIVGGPYDQHLPAIEDERVVYVDEAPGSSGVYLFQFGG